VIHKEGLCLSSGGINRLMMMMISYPPSRIGWFLSLSSMDAVKAAKELISLISKIDHRSDGDGLTNCHVCKVMLIA
jgi:hypothetical protein